MPDWLETFVMNRTLQDDEIAPAQSLRGGLLWRRDSSMVFQFYKSAMAEPSTLAAPKNRADTLGRKVAILMK
ncbi:hypothetical protein LTR43_009360, partial [Exophiala xenobiotica]